MCKRWLICLCFLLFCPVAVWAQETAPAAVPALPEEEIEKLLDELNQDVAASVPGFSLRETFQGLREGTLAVSWDGLGLYVFRQMLSEMGLYTPFMVKLLLLGILCAVLNQLQAAFSGEVAKISRLLVYLTLLSLALTSLQEALATAHGAIGNMVSFMQAVLPVMYTLLLAMGNLTSAALFKPLVLGSLVLLATIIQNIIVPLFFFGLILRIFNSISSQFRLQKLSELLDFCGKTALGMMMTIFIGVMSVQGAMGGIADSVALRTAKYSADLVPVVGKYFKDAVELVTGSGMLLKNALGLVGMIVIVLLVVGPVLKIAAMVITFKLTAALLEPLGEAELAGALQGIAKGLLLIFVAVASVAVMFFITIAIIVGTGNFSIMMS